LLDKIKDNKNIIIDSIRNISALKWLISLYLMTRLTELNDNIEKFLKK
jgi:hypothetical protein